MTRQSIFLCVVACSLPLTAQGFYVESRSNDDAGAALPVAYDTAMSVEFRIASTGLPIGDASEQVAIEAAFTSWQAVDCSTITFTRGADEAAPMARHWMTTSDRYILVYWSDDAALWGTGLGVGFFDWADDANGVLVGGQVILNSRDHAWSTTGEPDKMDVQGVVTALIGRVLGITSNMEMNATFPRYRPGDTSKRTLGTDDIAAIQYIYGDGTCTPPAPEGVCLGTPMEMCPPEVTTMPGDGGTAGPDGGVTTGMRDAGSAPGTDGGGVVPPGSGDDGGCGCVAAGRGRLGAGALALLALLGLTALRRRR